MITTIGNPDNATKSVDLRTIQALRVRIVVTALRRTDATRDVVSKDGLKVKTLKPTNARTEMTNEKNNFDASISDV